ncbi:SHOCT domain-containing protein [Dactylosporangium sp. CA-052675]|uniref:SHOCT domain-containing protein n=1 Tax=Dactylosporangium sp. CA-052675 TaxID=3239927 RepID=UPI003D911BC5
MAVFAWFWLMISMLNDLYRDPDVGGWGKAAWTVFLIVLPWIGALVYLVTRGRSMNERARQRAEHREAEVREYVREVAGSPSTADELTKLADLQRRGVLTQSEYDRAKASALASNGADAMRARG